MTQRLTDDWQFKEVAAIIQKYGVMPVYRELHKATGITLHTLDNKIKPHLEQYNPVLDKNCGIPDLRSFIRMMKAEQDVLITAGKAMKVPYTPPAIRYDSKLIREHYYEPMLEEIVEYVKNNAGRDLGMENLLALLKG